VRCPIIIGRAEPLSLITGALQRLGAAAGAGHRSLRVFRASAGDHVVAKAQRIHPREGDDTRRPLSQDSVHIAEW
jgi:hypothetical protein